MPFNLRTSIQSQLFKYKYQGANPTNFSFTDVTSTVNTGNPSTSWAYGNSFQGTGSSCNMSRTGQYAVIGGYVSNGGSATATPCYLTVTSNSGTSWTKYSLNLSGANYYPINALAMSGTGQYIYTVNAGYTPVRVSSNTGASFTDVTVGSAGINHRDIACSYDGKYAVVGTVTNSEVYMSCDFGSSWGNTGAYTFTCVAISNDGKTIIGSTAGGIFRTDNAQNGDVPNSSATWTSITGTVTGFVLMTLHMSISKNIILACPSANTNFFISYNGGASWVTKNVGEASNRSIGCMSEDGKYMLVVYKNTGGYTYYSSDYGQTFTRINSLPNLPTANSNNWFWCALAGNGSRAIMGSGNTISTNTTKLAYMSS